jgi:hypothetical protein
MLGAATGHSVSVAMFINRTRCVSHANSILTAE